MFPTLIAMTTMTAAFDPPPVTPDPPPVVRRVDALERRTEAFERATDRRLDTIERKLDRLADAKPATKAAGCEDGQCSANGGDGNCPCQGADASLVATPITYQEAYNLAFEKRFVLCVGVKPRFDFYGSPVYRLTDDPPEGVSPGYYQVSKDDISGVPYWWSSRMKGGYVQMTYPYPAARSQTTAVRREPVGPIATPYYAAPADLPAGATFINSGPGAGTVVMPAAAPAPAATTQTVTLWTPAASGSAAGLFSGRFVRQTCANGSCGQ